MRMYKYFSKEVSLDVIISFGLNLNCSTFQEGSKIIFCPKILSCVTGNYC